MQKESFFDILERYLKLNERMAVGYNEKEIEQIKHIYGIKNQKIFEKFLRIAGRSSGGLLSGNFVILYKDWSVREHILFQLKYKDIIFPKLKKLPYIFSVENEIKYYFFLKALEENNNIYCYDKKTSEVKDTGMNFDEYLVDLVQRYNPELKPIENESISGDIIVVK